MTMRLSELPSDEQIEEAANQRIEDRRVTGKKLIDVARQLQSAQQEVQRLTETYEAAYKEAVSDAWTEGELAANGFPTPIAVTKRRSRGRQRRTPNGNQPS